MRNNLDILGVAMEQLEKDYNFKSGDLKIEENIIVGNKIVEGRRSGNDYVCFFKTLCIGGKVIINAGEEILPWCEEKFLDANGSWFFEYPNLRRIDGKLMEFEHEIDDIHHYYLPKADMAEVKPITDVKWYEREDIFQFKDDDRFDEALLFDEDNPDVIAVAAFDKDCIMGMAGATADSETMWQIGINVLPEYRGRGIASNLVTLLKQEILRRGKVPFYGTIESHLNSQKVAIKSGFVPTWAELHSRRKRK